MSKKGLTLAEVLITLGVVGAVAAITMPTLISHHNKRVVETRLAKFYSEMSQAFNRALYDNGETEMSRLGTDYETQLAYVNKYITPYVEVLNVKKSGAGVDVIFKNGSKFHLEADNTVFYPLANGRNDFKGKNCFNFSTPNTYLPERYSYQKGFYPYLGNIQYLPSHSELYTHSIYGCKSSKVACDRTEQNKYCTFAIMQNGWKIPDDYPIRF